MPEPSTVVVHLNIELPRNPDTLAALTELLHSVADLPGVALRQPAVPGLPAPRRFTVDDADGRMRIAPSSRAVFRHGRPVRLTRLEFDLLLYLSEHPGQVLRRGTLMAEIWGIDEPLNSRTVDVHVRRLRDKLGGPSFITTVRGVGYRFDGGPQVVIEPEPDWAVV